MSLRTVVWLAWVLCLSPAVISRVMAEPVGPVIVKVYDQPLHEVSPLLFGHFVEHANWHGELGADAGLVSPDQLAPRVRALVASLEPPTLRYPGGTLVSNTDWLDFLNDPPAEEHARWGSPDVQVKYTFDGFLRDCAQWGAEPVLVVNFKKALLGLEPVDDCAEHAAALVAYCNLPVDADAPPRLLRWAELRARHGRVEPYGVKYFQIGNEIWTYSRTAREAHGETYPGWYVRCLDAYITAMRRVDPTIRLISDAANKEVNQAIREAIGERLDMMTSHFYGPWGMREVIREGQRVDPSELTEEEVWRAYVSVPEVSDETGMSLYPLYFDADTSGYPIAATEWNWNGWWALPAEEDRPMDSYWARGVGAAGILHGLIRSADRIRMAHQSMLIGINWGITTVRVPPAGPEEAFLLPSGAITGFYRRHHGGMRMKTEVENLPVFTQPYTIGTNRAKPKVAEVDIVVTGDDSAIYVHLISRAYDRDVAVVVDLTDFSSNTAVAELFLLQGELKPDPSLPVPMRETSRPVTCEGGRMVFDLPARAIGCLRVTR